MSLINRFNLFVRCKITLPRILQSNSNSGALIVG